jgi:hypothetical protein
MNIKLKGDISGRAPIGSGFTLQVLTKLRCTSLGSGLFASIPHVVAFLIFLANYVLG